MTAQMIGEPKPGNHTEKLVFDALQQGLPDDCIVYAEPLLVHKDERREPDFVVISPVWGVTVLEVKGWVAVTDRDRRTAWVRRQETGRVEEEKSPVDLARKSAHLLERMLREDGELCTYSGGRLDFPYRYAAILPGLGADTIKNLRDAWGESFVLGKRDLVASVITERLAAIPPKARTSMSHRQVNAVRAIINGDNKKIDRRTGQLHGIYSQEQEAIVRERVVVNTQSSFAPKQAELLPFASDSRAAMLESTMPAENVTLKSAQGVRLVRGYAGTGKTDILLLRTRFLYRNHPEFNILVTTFNTGVLHHRLKPELSDLKDRVDVMTFDSLCAAVYRRKFGHPRRVSPQNTEGVIAKLQESYPQIQEFGMEFLAEEFVWMKETGRTTRNAYVSGVREGRGGPGGRKLNSKMKKQVFDLFEAYQNHLTTKLRNGDWVDSHENTLRYLREGVIPEKRYDAILIDEAQHFAPTWMRIIDHHLKPGGIIFLCDDPSQSVYRTFSWKQKGVDVQGRTRWLRIPYRNTRQIFEAAYQLIAADEGARRLLAEAGEEVQPDLADKNVRVGPAPQVHCFPTFDAERSFAKQAIQELINQGVRPDEIAVLHTKAHVLKSYNAIVPKGVQVSEARKQTGMEFKAVIIPKAQDLSEVTTYTWQEYQSRQRKQLYTMMSRAQHWLYIFHEQRWPREFEPIRGSVEWVQH